MAAPRKPSCSPLPITELMTEFELLAGRGVTDDVLAYFYAGFLTKLYADSCQDLALNHLQLLITVGEIKLVELIATQLIKRKNADIIIKSFGKSPSLLVAKPNLGAASGWFCPLKSFT